MSSKKNFVFRIDENIYQALEKWAGDEFRSVNGQIELIIHQQLKETGRLKEAKDGKVKNSSKKP